MVGQTRKELETQRKKLKKEIEQVNKLLFTEKRNEKNALEELKDIQKKISVRAQLISVIKQEANALSSEISKNEKNINNLNTQLKKLQEDYSNMIFKSYKSKSLQSKTMFLLSSQNFYQAYKRLEYMKQYASFRKKQGEEIITQTFFVKKLNDSLTKRRQKKETLLLSEKYQKNQIEIDKKNKEQLISIIKKKEKEYKTALQKKVSEEKKVIASIDKLIKEEIVKANRIAEAKLKDKPKASKKNEFFLSPEAKVLAENFELNKGRLPWPVKEGIVVRKFGDQPHPSFPGITINGTGLHIVTKEGSYAEAIFNGEVLNILVSAEGRKNVLIRHGNYISSYNNLENILVKKGDEIKTNQRIGEIFTDKVTNKTTLIFVLFKNTERLNPSSWILNR